MCFVPFSRNIGDYTFIPKYLRNFVLDFLSDTVYKSEEKQPSYSIKISDIIFLIAVKLISPLGINLTRKVLILYEENYKNDYYTRMHS